MKIGTGRKFWEQELMQVQLPLPPLWFSLTFCNLPLLPILCGFSASKLYQPAAFTMRSEFPLTARVLAKKCWQTFMWKLQALYNSWSSQLPATEGLAWFVCKSSTNRTQTLLSRSCHQKPSNIKIHSHILISNSNVFFSEYKFGEYKSTTNFLWNPRTYKFIVALCFKFCKCHACTNPSQSLKGVWQHSWFLIEIDHILCQSKIKIFHNHKNYIKDYSHRSWPP